jgi:polysaccharide biosynthesis protein PslG
VRARSLCGLLWVWAVVGCGAPAEPSPTLGVALGIAVPHFAAARPQDVALRVEAGARWVRRDVAWEKVEREVGVFDFTEADAVIDAEVAAGVEVLVVLDYGHPAYAADANGDSTMPPDDVADFGRYAAAVAEHFRGRVSAYELWNEPNFFLFWKPAPSPEGYAALAAEAAERVRLVDPDATILLGGSLGNWDTLSFDGQPWGFLEAALAARPDLLERVDALAFHPYTWLQQEPPEVSTGTVDTAQTGYVDMITDLRRIASEAGRSELPLWATEQGFHTATKDALSRGVTEEEQGHLLVRSTVLALAQGVEKVFHYTYRDGPTDPYNKEAHFGLVRHASGDEEPERKPAFEAHQALASALEGAVRVEDLRGELGLAPDVFAFRLVSVRGDDTLIAWTTAPGGASLGLEGVMVELSSAPVYVPVAPR